MIRSVRHAITLSWLAMVSQLVLQGTNCGRTSQPGSLLRIHSKTTTPPAVVVMATLVYGSSKVVSSRTGKSRLLCCGSTGNVCSPELCALALTKESARPQLVLVKVS